MLPWLKDLKEPIADPIDPVCPEDVRPSVKGLLEKHRESIEKIKAEVSKEPLYEATKHDDLWLMRFGLSHKWKMKPILKAIRLTLQYRVDYKLDETDIRDAAPHFVEEGPVHEYWCQRCPGGTLVFVLPDAQRGVICILSMAKFVPGSSAKLNQETWDYAFIYSTEWAFQWLDYVTRSTGRLTRQVRLIDMANVSMKFFDRKDMKCDAAIMGKMEDFYPQLLESIKLCNAPSFMHVIWKLARAIMPKRVVEKLDVIDPKKNSKERKSLLRFITMEQLPVEYGGENTVPPCEWSTGKVPAE